MRLKRTVRCAITVATAAVLTACGGSGGSSGNPAGPSPTPTAPAPVPSAQNVETALAQQIGALTIKALREVSQQIAPAGIGTAASTFNGTYQVSCPSGGSMQMIQLPTNLPFIGQVSLENVIQVYSSCSFSGPAGQVRADGRPAMRGTYWKAEAPGQGQDIRLQGPIALTPGANMNVNGQLGIDGAFTGTIGSVNVITGPTVPPPPPPPSPAQLLAGGWSGRVVQKIINSDATCNFTHELTLNLTANGANNLGGNFTSRVLSGACNFPIGPIGGLGNGAVAATASNGRINFGGTWTGEYNASGTWMGGDCGNDASIGWSCQWQVGR